MQYIPSCLLSPHCLVKPTAIPSSSPPYCSEIEDQCGQCLPSQSDPLFDVCVGCDGVPFSGSYELFCGDCSLPLFSEEPPSIIPSYSSGPSSYTPPIVLCNVGCDGVVDSNFLLDACSNCKQLNDPSFSYDAQNCPPITNVPDISPLFFCWDVVPSALGVNSYVVFGGYTNPLSSPSDFSLPVGDLNQFNLVPNRGQPVIFKAGGVTAFGAPGTFTVAWNGDPLTWTLNGEVYFSFVLSTSHEQSVSINLSSAALQQAYADFRCPSCTLHSTPQLS